MPQSARLVLNQANLRASVAALAAFAASREAAGASAASAETTVQQAADDEG